MTSGAFISSPPFLQFLKWMWPWKNDCAVGSPKGSSPKVSIYDLQFCQTDLQTWFERLYQMTLCINIYIYICVCRYIRYQMSTSKMCHNFSTWRWLRKTRSSFWPRLRMLRSPVGPAWWSPSHLSQINAQHFFWSEKKRPADIQKLVMQRVLGWCFHGSQNVLPEWPAKVNVCCNVLYVPVCGDLFAFLLTTPVWVHEFVYRNQMFASILVLWSSWFHEIVINKLWEKNQSFQCHAYWHSVILLQRFSGFEKMSRGNASC